jgi:tRNA(Met) cytidine acetyltransferase
LGSLAESVEAFLEALRSTRFRGLIVVNACRREDAVEELASMAGGDCLLVSERELRSGRCRVELSLAGFERALGGEFSAAIVSARGLLRPSVLAGVAETVRGGGFLAIVAPRLAEWDPGPPGGRGFYRRYLTSSIGRCRAHLWLEHCGGEMRLVSKRLDLKGGRGSEWSPAGFKSRAGVPRSLLSLARTQSQAEALEAGARFLRSGARSLFLRGDRGRGKSFAVGLILALAVYWHVAGRAVVVGPTPLSVESLMRGLLAGLEALGMKGRFKVVRGRGGEVVRVTGPWFRISYETPETAEPAPLTVVDEAAAVGVARVRRLGWRGGKIIVSTTIHGYEGSGRAFARILPGLLPKPMVEAELREPIRYPEGDPLEEWVYETFLLKAEPGPPPPSLEGGAEHRLVDPWSEAERGRLAELYGILVQAHYRNTPDDLLAIMDSPHHHIHALYVEGRPVAVADVVEESDSVDPEARIALDRLKLMAGGAAGLKAYRVSRIAVHPDLQRRGLGSQLLRHIEEWASALGADLVTTMFSRHDVIEFWLKNGFKPYYISPRYNRVTGEKNVAMAKPLTARGAEALREASSAMLHKLLLAGPSVYRDLAAEKIAALIHSMEPSRPPLALTGSQRRMLSLYLSGEVEMEQAMDAVFIVAVVALSALRPIPLSGEKLVALVARVIQGKPLNEVAEILGVPPDDAQRLVDEAVREIVSSASSLV